MRPHGWYLLVIAILCSWLLQSTFRLREIKSQLENVYANYVTIKAVDADSKVEVPLTLQTPGRGYDQSWPHYTIWGVKRSQLRISWIDVNPLKAAVSSEGYEEQPLILDAKSDKEITVYLGKLPAEIK